MEGPELGHPRRRREAQWFLRAEDDEVGPGSGETPQ